MNPKSIPQLTKSEESVMKALWAIDSGFIKDMIAIMPEPKPHANTVNTLLKILAEKGFVTSDLVGNANCFKSLISREEYSKRKMGLLIKGYFNNSFSDMISFFVKEKAINTKDLEEILESIKNSQGK